MKYKNFAVLDRQMLTSKLGISAKTVERGVFRYERAFASTTIKGKNILEIGAGSGVLSCMLSLGGAKSVTALEPELAGSSQSVFEKFERNVEALGSTNVTLVKKTLQEYELGPNLYDIVVSISSINHWDEQACINLHKDKDAQKTYIDMFRKIHKSLTGGGQLLLFESGKWNLFSWVSNHLGIHNPFSPSIEWFKHQQPGLWSQILKDAGFSQVAWKWLFPSPPNVVCQAKLDNPLFNNAFLTYFITSHFIIWATKQHECSEKQSDRVEL